MFVWQGSHQFSNKHLPNICSIGMALLLRAVMEWINHRPFSQDFGPKCWKNQICLTNKTIERKYLNRMNNDGGAKVIAKESHSQNLFFFFFSFDFDLSFFQFKASEIILRSYTLGNVECEQTKLLEDNANVWDLRIYQSIG